MDTFNVIVGNICSLLAMFTDSISSTRKTAKSVLRMQSLSQLIYFVGTAILGGYSGAVQNAVSIIRNEAAVRQINNKCLERKLVLLGVGLGCLFTDSWVGLLPVIANLQYTLAVFRFKNNDRALKVCFVIAVVMFAIFNFAIQNYVGVFSNLVVMVTTIIALLRRK